MLSYSSHHSQLPVVQWVYFISANPQPIFQLPRLTSDFRWGNQPCPDQPAKSQAYKLNDWLLFQASKLFSPVLHSQGSSAQSIYSAYKNILSLNCILCLSFQFELHPAQHFADVLCIEVKWTGWQYTALTSSFPDLEPVCCSMSGSNCCSVASWPAYRFCRK